MKLLGSWDDVGLRYGVHVGWHTGDGSHVFLVTRTRWKWLAYVAKLVYLVTHRKQLRLKVNVFTKGPRR
jgi:hypothetical protein